MKSTREFKPPRPLVLIEEVVVLEAILVGPVQHHSDLDLKTNAPLKRDPSYTNASYV
jgi:hypothetical protein